MHNSSAARFEQDNAALEQDEGRERQRLDGQEQAPAVGRALYQEYLLRRADLEQTHTQSGPRAELLGADAGRTRRIPRETSKHICKRRAGLS